MICGTSTGGIIALGIASKIPICEIINMYEKNADNIFPSNNRNMFMQPIISTWYKLWQLGGYKYSNVPLSKYLSDIFQDKKMIEANNLLCIPSYNLSLCQNVVFKNVNCTEYEFLTRDREYKMIDVALATSSAPTYFKMHNIDDSYYLDGGLWANNPTMVGILESLRHFVGKDKKYDNYDVLSIGNVNKYEYPTVKNDTYFWNMLKIGKLLNVFFNSNSFCTTYMSNIISKSTNGNILRIEYEGNLNNDILLDDTNELTIKQLKRLGKIKGQMYIDKNNIKYGKYDIGRFFKNKKTFKLG